MNAVTVQQLAIPCRRPLLQLQRLCVGIEWRIDLRANGALHLVTARAAIQTCSSIQFMMPLRHGS